MAWILFGFASLALAGKGLGPRISIALYLAVAAWLRLWLLPLPPTLSDDILRYVWDGRVISAGFNPYLSAPEDEILEALRDDRWQIMPHKEVPTVYPPLALGVFAVGGRSADPVIGIKILLAFCDWIGCALLFLLAERLKVPPSRAVWYAWNPLVTLEVAGQGHVDGLMIACTVAAVWWLHRARPWQAGLAAAAGVAAKLVPLVALVPWILGRRNADRARPWARNVQFAVAAGLGLIVVFSPVAWTTGMPPGLVTYGVSWEFNGPVYEPLWRAVDTLDPVDAIKGGIDRLKNVFGDWTGHEPWNRLYHFVYPQFLAKLVAAAGFGLYWLWICSRPRRPVVVAGQVFGAVLLASATVYPWYLLWVLPWAALAGHRAWLAASVLGALAYLPQHIDGLDLFPWIWASIWIPVFVLLWRSPSWSRLFAVDSDPHSNPEDGPP